MDITASLQIIPVTSLAGRCQAFPDKGNGHVQEKIHIRTGQVEIAIFGPENPIPQAFPFLRGREFGALVGDVGVNITVQQDGLSAFQRGADLRGRPVTVLCEQQSYQLRVHPLDGTEIPPQKTADKVSVNGGVIPGEVDVFHLAEA